MDNDSAMLVGNDIGLTMISTMMMTATTTTIFITHMRIIMFVYTDAFAEIYCCCKENSSSVQFDKYEYALKKKLQMHKSKR